MYSEYKKFAEDERPKKKLTHKEEYNMIEIKNKEKAYFQNVFRELCELEKEESSDNNTKEKKYKNIKGTMSLNNTKKKKSNTISSSNKNKVNQPPKVKIQKKKKKKKRKKIVCIYIKSQKKMKKN